MGGLLTCAYGQMQDVPAGHWAQTAVERVVSLGLLQGYPDGRFQGQESLSRYQAAVIIHRLLTIIEQEISQTRSSPTLASLDPATLQLLVKASQELQGTVVELDERLRALETQSGQNLLAKQNLNASPQGATKEDLAALRQEMLAWLSTRPQPEPSLGPGVAFVDVPAGHWAQQALQGLSQRGLLQGYPDGQFRGQQPLSRYEAAVLLFKAVQALESTGTAALDINLGQALTKGMQELAAELRGLGVKVEALEQQPLRGLLPAPNASGTDPIAMRDLLQAIAEASETGYAAYELGEKLAAQMGQMQLRISGLEQSQGEVAQTLAALSSLNLALGMQVGGLQEQLGLLSQRSEATQSAVNELAQKQLVQAQKIEQLSQQQTQSQTLWEQSNSAAQARDLALQQNLALLEKRLLSLRLGAVLHFGGARLSGDNFDVDRLFGLGDGQATPDLQSQRRTEFSVGLAGGFELGQLKVQDAKASLSVDPFSRSVQLSQFSLRGSLAHQSFSLGFDPQARYKLTEWLLNYSQTPTQAARLQLELARGLVLLAYLGEDTQTYAGARLSLESGVLRAALAWAQQGGSDAAAIQAHLGDEKLYLRGETAWREGQSASYIQAGFKVASAAFAANYRLVGAAFEGGPYRAGQEGFGMEASFGTPLLGVNVFWDTALSHNQQAYGLALTTRLGGLEARAYYNQAQQDGGARHSIDQPHITGYDSESGRFGSNYGLRLRWQEGPHLLGAEYRQSLDHTDLEAVAKFSLRLGKVGLTPFARYHLFANSSQPSQDYQSLKAGLLVQAHNLVGPLGLEGSAVWRGAQGGLRLSEHLLLLALVLQDGPLPGSIRAGYGVFQGSNRLGFEPGKPDALWQDGIYDGARFGAASPASIEHLEGWFLRYDWETLSLWYALYQRDQGADGVLEGSARQFGMRYSLPAPQD